MSPAETVIDHGSALSLTCSIPDLPPSVDTPTTVQFVWTTPDDRYNTTEEVNGTSNVLVIPNVEMADTGEFNCTVTILDASGSYYVMNSASFSDVANVTVSKSRLGSTISSEIFSLL